MVRLLHSLAVELLLVISHIIPLLKSITPLFLLEKKKNPNKPHFGMFLVCMSSCPLRQTARPRVEAPVGEEKVSAFLGVMAELLSTFNSLVPIC